MITASHNPGEYNGCKMVRKEAFPLSGEAGIKEMKEMIMAGAIRPAAGVARDPRSWRDIMPRYLNHVMSFVDEFSIKPFNVVLDAARRRQHRRAQTVRTSAVPDDPAVHGAGRHVRQLTKPNPLLEENRQDITAEVIRQKADIGLRGMVTPIAASSSTAPASSSPAIHHRAARRSVPDQVAGETIIYDVRASYAVKDIVAKYGGKGADESRRPCLHQAPHAREQCACSAARSPGTTTSATISTRTTASFRR
jgi:phosphomannomutase